MGVLSFEDVVRYTREGLGQRLTPGLRVKLIRFGRQERFRNVLVFLFDSVRQLDREEQVRWKPFRQQAKDRRMNELQIVADLICNWEAAEENFDEPSIFEVKS